MKSIGGVQNYIRTLVDALKVVLGSDCVRMVTVADDPVARADGNLALAGSVKARFLVAAVAKALAWSPDLVICAHIGLAPAARIVQKVTRTPYWLVLYGIEVWGELPPAKVEALRGAERYLTITRFTLDAMAARHNLKEPRASILPPTLPKALARSPEAKGAPRKDSPRPVVLTVGRLAASERYKGHDAILDAWPAVLRRVPHAEYLIVGGGDDRARLESRVSEMGMTESVHFAGSVSQEELDVCYDRCSIFAMPARTELDARAPRGEGFGIVFLEAMAHGKAVIGPRAGAPAEFIHSGEHGLLVDPADSGELAGALIELLEDPERARRMGDAGKEWVAREFTFDRFCERLREALLQ
ncbi:MAG TPA: glycosyltransferase family 4 protein [Candidatus Acidoferrales bacterium]|nr:glycosyltransferase family 4 protein [Candidatus Acidoferrales bacterium]